MNTTAFEQALVIETVPSASSKRKTMSDPLLNFRPGPLDVVFGNPITAVIFGIELGMLDANDDADTTVLEPNPLGDANVSVGFEERLVL